MEKLLQSSAFSTSPLAEPLATPLPSTPPLPSPANIRQAPWKHANNASAPGHSNHSRTRRDQRHQLREDLEPVRTVDRLKACGRSPLQGGATLTLAESGQAHFSGLETCGSVWSCPVCSAKIRATRAAELERFAVGWIGAGHGLAMATFTIRHHRRERLAEQMAGLSSAWRRMVAGRPWRRLREEYGLQGYARAEEVTHGGNGWHPHFHALLWTRRPMDDATAARLEGELYGLWHTACEREGLGLPTRAHGVRVDAVRRGREGAADIARYVAKVQDGTGVERALGNEMLRADLKDGRGKASRSPFEIARDLVRSGDAEDAERWQEYERATRGRKALTWSRGLKADLAALLEVAADERDDQEVAAEEAGGAPLAVFPREAWFQHVVAVPGRRVCLLRAAERFGADGVRGLVEMWGLEWGSDVLSATG